MHAWNADAMRLLRERLIKWFRQHARDLPWRRTRDPYRIWVSEIMLQQTQVATVTAYYERFLTAFPDVRTLAAAPEEKVLRLWEGLGYYRRARHLHAAAKVIASEHDGQFPRSLEEVRKLPGVGRYTAGAILSFAHDESQPIVEANTQRLYSRLLAYDGALTTRAALDVLWQFAGDVLPIQGAGELNQALMELGSLVCTPRSPDCGACPLAEWCPTRAGGLQDRIPRSIKKLKYEEVTELAVVAWRGGRVLVRPCGAGERWAGLWDFPRFAARPTPSRLQQLNEGVRMLTGVEIEPGDQLTVIKHGVTRFRITLHCHAAQTIRTPRRLLNNARWTTLDELSSLPLSVTARQIADLISNQGTRIATR